MELARLMRKGVDAVDELVNREKAKGGVPRVYIHCTAGMGRAPAVACVYLVKHGGYAGKLSEALAHVKAHRKVTKCRDVLMMHILRSLSLSRPLSLSLSRSRDLPSHSSFLCRF